MWKKSCLVIAGVAAWLASATAAATAPATGQPDGTRGAQSAMWRCPDNAANLEWVLLFSKHLRMYVGALNAGAGAAYLAACMSCILIDTHVYVCINHGFLSQTHQQDVPISQEHGESGTVRWM